MNAHDSGSEATTASRTAKPIMVALAVVGGLTLLTAGASQAWQSMLTLNSVSSPSAVTGGSAGENASFAAADVRSIQLEVAAATVDLGFGDVDEVTVLGRGELAEGWIVDLDSDGELTIASPDNYPSLSFGVQTGSRGATVILPESLRGIDLDVEVAAGQVSIEGDFSDLSIDISTGKVTAEGTAQKLAVDLATGALDATLEGVERAEFDVAAGEGKITLNGKAPTTVDAAVSLGSLEVELPDAPYRVQSEVEAGSLVNKLREDETAKSRVNVSVELGSLKLTPVSTK